MEALRKKIRDIKNFPRAGIVFKDLTPALADPAVFREIVDALARRWRDQDIDKVVGIESRGFIFASPLAYRLGTGFAIARKAGKLPYECVSETYALEYGEGTLELHVDAIERGERVLIVDDLLATGGTAEAVGKLIARQGGEIAGYSFVIELGFLHGARRLGTGRVHSILKYDQP